MKKHFYVLALAGLLGLNSCSDSFEPSVDFGDKTYINDYSALVDAVNDLSKTLSERLSALNSLMEQGFLSVKVAINENTGAISTQTTTLKDGLGTLNTTILDGLTALKTTTEANGEKLVSAINKNGEVIALQLDTTGKLISAQISGSTSALISTLKSNNTDLSSKLSAINSSISTGLTHLTAEVDTVHKKFDITNEALDKIQGNIKNQTDSIGKLAAAVLNGFNSVNSTLKAQNDSIGKLIISLDGNTQAIYNLDKDLTAELQHLHDSLSATGGKIVTAINKEGEIIVAAINGENGLSSVIKTGLDNINNNITTLNTNLNNLQTVIAKGDSAIVAQLKNLKQYANGIVLDDSEKMDGNKYHSLYVTPTAWGSIKNDPAALENLKNLIGETRKATPKGNQWDLGLNTSEADRLKKGDTTPHAGPDATGNTKDHVLYSQTGDSGEEIVISSTIVIDGVTLFKVVKVLTYTIYEVHIVSGKCGYPNITYLYIDDARGKNWMYDGDTMGGALGSFMSITNIRFYLYDKTTGVYKDAPDAKLFSANSSTNTGEGYAVLDTFYE